MSSRENVMKQAEEILPWKVTDISLRPYDEMWSMNPSLHYDGTLWRCVLRCCDYAMPNGVTIRSKKARPVGQQTKNAMVIFDPKTWRPIQIFRMREKDGLPRESTPHFGYEDMRLFKTDKGGLQGIAAALHLKREHRTADGMPQHQPPEQVLLSFDESYDIVSARPIRGDGWSGTPQKNWVPFDDCAEPRFLYSIDKGTMFNDRGSVHGDAARARPSINARPLAPLPPRERPAGPVTLPQEKLQEAPAPTRPDQEDPRPPPRQPDRRMPIRGGDVRIVRGGRMALDAISSRPSSRPSSPPAAHSSSRPITQRSSADSTRTMGAGRVLLPKYPGLRGGTQLSRVGDDAWLGIGHAMKFVGGKKYYWHVLYLVDSRGDMTAASEPMKLASNGIEFAAGLALDGERVVVSFGVDDMECRLGETRLSAVMETLKPISP